MQRERTEREREKERADQASVSKHIIMYFFKTQKATPQQRTLQNEHRERESGRERERGRSLLVGSCGKQKQSVVEIYDTQAEPQPKPKQLSSRTARGDSS